MAIVPLVDSPVICRTSKPVSFFVAIVRARWVQHCLRIHRRVNTHHLDIQTPVLPVFLNSRIFRRTWRCEPPCPRTRDRHVALVFQFFPLEIPDQVAQIRPSTRNACRIGSLNPRVFQQQTPDAGSNIPIAVIFLVPPIKLKHRHRMGDQQPIITMLQSINHIDIRYQLSLYLP